MRFELYVHFVDAPNSGALLQEVLTRLGVIERTIRTQGDTIMAALDTTEQKLTDLQTTVDGVVTAVGVIIQDCDELKALAAAVGIDQAAIDRLNTGIDAMKAKAMTSLQALIDADTRNDPTPGGPTP